MNYTDVDDKIINRANELGEEPLKLSQRYIEDYANDLKSLNVLPATSNPQVSKTMPLIIRVHPGTDPKGSCVCRGEWRCLFQRHEVTMITANFPVARSKTCRPARASKWKKRKIILWISPYGKPPSPVKFPGIARGARAVPAGTSNALP